MKNDYETHHMVDVLFILTLFFLFAFSSLTLVILGANIYRNTVDRMGKYFNERTAYTYVLQKIRQNDSTLSNDDPVTIGKLGDVDACILNTTINDISYSTYLYEYNDHLCELMARSELDMAPEAGTQIIELKGFDISPVNDSLYKITLTDTDDISKNIFVCIHSEASQ